MTHSYWDRVLRQRLSRRRTLVAAGGLGLAATLAAACGGDDDGGSPSGSASPSGGGGAQPQEEEGLVHKVTDETGKAVRGGIYSHNHGELELSIDPITMIAPTNAGVVAMVYSQFVKYGTKLPPDRPTPADIEGDAMTSWEFAPDGLSVTYKLRPNHKFDPRPPTNGRAMTVEDVKWSFEATEAMGPLGGAVYASVGEGGPLSGIEVIDNETVKIKTAFPYGATNEVLAYLVQYIAPVEGESGFDRKAEMRGSGPFRLDSFQEGVSAEFSSNTDWYVENQPFLDGMRFAFIGEPAVENAQFTAKQLWKLLPENPLDTIDIKKRNPEVLLQQEPPRLTPGSYGITVGRYFAQDERLRRAVSMLIDRETMIKSVRNTSVWENEGIDVELRWDGHLSSQSANWIDPNGDGLGEHAKWFQYNPAEAKKLMDAAGYDGRELVFIQRAAFQEDQVAILSQMLKEGGFNIVDQPVPASEWREHKFNGPGTYDGFLFNTYIAGFNDEGFFADKYTEAGRDRVIAQNIPWLSDRIDAITRELDPKKKVDLVKDFQRELAEHMLDVPTMALQPVLQYDVTWPWLRNTAWVVPGFSFWATSARPHTRFWVDQALLDQYGP